MYKNILSPTLKYYNNIKISDSFLHLILQISRNFHVDYLICLPNTPVRWEHIIKL